ncbi:MAG: signal peptidase II [Anaerovoracaceae bacterium]
MRYYFLGILLVALDQITKAAVRANMFVGESIPVIGEFFQLTHVENSGAAFSILSGQRMLLVVVPVIGIAFALWYFHRHKGDHWTLYCSWSLIIAGGVGNLIDRLAFGTVTDMFDFSIFPPVFNVADIGVTTGCALFILYVLMGDRWKKKKNTNFA